LSSSDPKSVSTLASGTAILRMEAVLIRVSPYVTGV
jgi:hypothetical protein